MRKQARSQLFTAPSGLSWYLSTPPLGCALRQCAYISTKALMSGIMLMYIICTCTKSCHSHKSLGLFGQKLWWSWPCNHTNFGYRAVNIQGRSKRSHKIPFHTTWLGYASRCPRGMYMYNVPGWTLNMRHRQTLISTFLVLRFSLICSLRCSTMGVNIFIQFPFRGVKRCGGTGTRRSSGFPPYIEIH